MSSRDKEHGEGILKSSENVGYVTKYIEQFINKTFIKHIIFQTKLRNC